MSFAVMQELEDGYFVKRQKLLDVRLDALVAESGREEDRYSIAKLLFAALRDRANEVASVEVETGARQLKGELLELSVRTARALRAAGCLKGEVVMIVAKRHNLTTVPYLAALFVGALPFQIDENATESEILSYLRMSSSRFAFADSEIACRVAAAAKQSDRAEETHVITFSQIEDFTKEHPADVPNFRVEETNRGDIVLLACSSGSTGAPKAVALTNYGIVASTPTLPPFIDDHEENESFLMTSSVQWISYIFYTNKCILEPIVKIQSDKPATSSNILEWIRKYKPTIIMMPPGKAAELLSLPGYRHGDLACLRHVLVGGAYVSVELFRALKREMNPHVNLIVACGCTEVAGCATIMRGNCADDSIGKEVNTMLYKIVDEFGQEMPIGKTGELWVKTKEPYCKGYFNDANNLSDLFTKDGWFKTGDLVYKNDKGEYFYVERLKCLIKNGSYHVYPAEVEATISEMKGVTEAGVCWTGRELVALIQLQPGATVTAQQVLDHTKNKLSFYKQPTGGVLFGELPRTVTGKLSRAALLDVVNSLLCKTASPTLPIGNGA